MKIIGITGGVGAGKSTVLDYLEKEFNACVLQADKIGHLVMEPDVSVMIWLSHCSEKKS